MINNYIKQLQRNLTDSNWHSFTVTYIMTSQSLYSSLGELFDTGAGRIVLGITHAYAALATSRCQKVHWGR